MSSLFEAVSASAGWPFYQHVIFDCDSTLSTIEGIDILASDPQTQKKVIELTDAAMSGATPLDEVYGKRLELICPSRKAVRLLSQAYLRCAIADAKLTISELQRIGCEVYIVSGGLLEPVREFGIALGVAASNIRAVDIEYDQLDGEWWRPNANAQDQSYLMYRHSDLAESHGKAAIIRDMLKQKQGASILLGDGVSDLLARNAVDLFVGYAGVAARERVCKEAPLYINNLSLLPMLPLVAGSRRFFKLEASLRQKCIDCVRINPPIFNRKVLERNFLGSFL